MDQKDGLTPPERLSRLIRAVDQSPRGDVQRRSKSLNMYSCHPAVRYVGFTKYRTPCFVPYARFEMDSTRKDRTVESNRDI